MFGFIASAHSGNTDAQGGHYNHSTNEYHYHHGYPAHQHKNGRCPYETRIIVAIFVFIIVVILPVVIWLISGIKK